MLPSDPVFYALAALFLGFVFFVYLFLRRTVQGFREGFDDGKRDGKR